MLKFLAIFDFCIVIAFALCCVYRSTYLILSLLRQLPRYATAAHTHKYVILIPVHGGGENMVHLLDSIRQQTYPSEGITVLVWADKRMEDAARLCCLYGVRVLERPERDTSESEYTFSDLVDYVQRQGETFDALLFVEPDSVLSPDYLVEMDNCFSAGNRVVSGYCNTENIGTDWISSGYGVWNLHESAQQNPGRNLRGVSAVINGAAYLMAWDVVCHLGDLRMTGPAWDIPLMSELLLCGEAVSLCPSAILCSRQPDALPDFWSRQVSRYREHRHMLMQYGLRLFQKAWKRDRSCADFLMNVMPHPFLSVLTLAVHAGLWLMSLLHDLLLPLWPGLVESAHSTLPGPIYPLTPHVTMALLFSLLMVALIVWLILFPVSLSVVMTEQKKIRATFRRKMIMTLTFPVFMLALPFAAFVAFFKPSSRHADDADVASGIPSDKTKSYVRS